MPALDNDFLRLKFEGGQSKDLLISKSGMNWPPPDRLAYGGIIYRRTLMSALSDEQVREMDMIPRGAEYELAPMEEQLNAPDTIPQLVILPPILT